ncbi:four helix bundle protein [Candidatus Binatia bacterium]|nr:four helix bundle protein [Candidatus Binatia bacterium]
MCPVYSVTHVPACTGYHPKEQLLLASQAIPPNIAEGNGKATDGDRRRYFEIACGSALECGAIQDVLEVCGALGVTATGIPAVCRPPRLRRCGHQAARA